MWQFGSDLSEHESAMPCPLLPSERMLLVARTRCLYHRRLLHAELRSCDCLCAGCYCVPTRLASFQAGDVTTLMPWDGREWRVCVSASPDGEVGPWLRMSGPKTISIAMRVQSRQSSLQRMNPNPSLKLNLDLMPMVDVDGLRAMEAMLQCLLRFQSGDIERRRLFVQQGGYTPEAGE